jgi:hypothetical protein
MSGNARRKKKQRVTDRTGGETLGYSLVRVRISASTGRCCRDGGTCRRHDGGRRSRALSRAISALFEKSIRSRANIAEVPSPGIDGRRRGGAI